MSVSPQPGRTIPHAVPRVYPARRRTVSHPCAGHGCDHCYLCDVVGICCATGARATSASTDCLHSQALREALVQEAPTFSGLGELIRLEIAAQQLPARRALGLPAGASPVGDVLSINTNLDQEAEHVLAPRRHHR